MSTERGLMELSPNEIAGRALTTLASRLDAIIEQRLAGELQGLEWTELLKELDRSRGKAPGIYSRSDVQSQLRILTERMGNLGFPLDDGSRIVSTLGSELRIMRNRVAHGSEIDMLDAWRTCDFVVRLLRHFGDSEGDARASDLRDSFMRLHPAGLPPESEESPSAPRCDEGEGVAEVIAAQETLVREEAAPVTTLGNERVGFEPWVQAVVGDPSVLDGLRSPKNAERVRAVIEEVVEVEGPVAEDRVALLVCRAFGLGRVEEKRLRAVKRQISHSAVSRDDHGYLWPISIDPQSWTEFRPYIGGFFRDFGTISPVELANAASFWRRRHPVLNSEGLARLVMQTFGMKRKTKKVEGQLVLARLVEEARVGSVDS